LSLSGRGIVGLPMIALGLVVWQTSRRLQKNNTAPYVSITSRRPIIRAAAIELEIDKDRTAIDGHVLTGTYEGRALSQLQDSELILCFNEIATDPESAGLFEAYLDSRMPGWRQNPHLDFDLGQTSPPGSGPVTQEEAYQILGLAPGATTQEISDAHRLLMKIVHPDNGGSTYLAARINGARDRLAD